MHTVPVLAAVSECLAEMSGKAVEHNVELEARKQALANWVEKAGKIGPGYTRWQLAYDRRIDCSKASAGYSCHAIARPCMIKHVPPQGVVPLKRGAP